MFRDEQLEILDEHAGRDVGLIHLCDAIAFPRELVKPVLGAFKGATEARCGSRSGGTISSDYTRLRKIKWRLPIEWNIRLFYIVFQMRQRRSRRKRSMHRSIGEPLQTNTTSPRQRDR